MKARPIIFGSPMIRALLSGAKTQTRRIMKPQPTGDATKKWPDPNRWSWPFNTGRSMLSLEEVACGCPYGTRGDQLWVRETHAQFAVGNRTGTSPQCVAYRATCEDGGFDYVNNGDEVMRMKVTKWTPAIFMPRWASRITLEITDVRVQRLQDISEDDACAEGVAPYTPPHGHISPDQRVPGPGFEHVRLGDQPHRLPFADLWREIHGDYSWDANPWVWAITFRRLP